MGTFGRWCRFGLAGLAGWALALPLAAQPPARVAVTLDGLLKHPGFYHERLIALVAAPTDVNRSWRILVSAPRTFLLLPASGTPPSGPVELRGRFFDVARLTQDRELPMHPDLMALVQRLYPDQVIPRDTVFALDNASWTESPEGASPSLRQLVLAPSPFDGKTVTVRGRFRGQNLFGDLPAWPRQSRWDFVLQAADASLWVTGLRPKGRGFDLDPTSKRDTGTWLEVSGVVHLAEGVPTIEARSIAESQPLADLPAEPVAAPPPPEPPPAVIFSAPVNGEPDVSRMVTVRVQFSRDMTPESFADHVKVEYGPGVTDAVPAFTATYRPENRGLEIEFASPLSLGAPVVVSLLPGITATDGSLLSPSQITFTVER